MAETLYVRGLRELLQATDRAGKETKKFVRSEFRKVAEPVLRESQDRLRRLDPVPVKTIEGLRIVVRRRGVISVEQRLRKTTGDRPDWGGTQMTRGLLPSLTHNEQLVGRLTEKAFDRICDHLEGK